MIKHTLQHGNAHTAIFLKYVWPFFDAMHKRVNPFRTNFPFVSMGRIEIKKSIFVQKQSNDSSPIPMQRPTSLSNFSMFNLF